MPLSPDAPLLGNHPGSCRARSGFRTLLIRADHAISWPDATPEVRERLVKRLDDTARALGLTSRGAYWVWAKRRTMVALNRALGII
jgi:hypothetical protein